MFSRIVYHALPRRITAYYLLFCLGAVTWVTAGSALVAWSAQTSRIDDTSFTKLRKATAEVSLAKVLPSQEQLQRLVEKIQVEGPYAYCAIVGEEGHYLAHSQVDQIGEPHTEPIGARLTVDGFERVRYTQRETGAIYDYSTPIKQRERHVGSLHIGLSAPSLRTVLFDAIHDSSWVPLGALLFAVGGAVVMYQTLHPMAEIDAELRAVALTSAPSEVELHTVKVRGAAAYGWNQLVEQGTNSDVRQGLDDRIGDSLERVSEQKMLHILESLPEGVAITDKENRVTFANQMFFALARNGCAEEHDSAERALETVEQLLELCDSDSAHAAFFDPQARQRAVHEELSKEIDGVQSVLSVSRQPMRCGGENNTSGFVWSVRDVTQRKLAEQVRDQFLDAATHEMRTPLANIRAYAETIVLADMTDAEQTKEFCNTINTEAARLARFIDDLLSIRSMEVGSLSVDRQEIDMKRFLHEVVEKTRGQMEKTDIHFESMVPEKLPPMRLDKDKLAVALVNILGNAVKYTPSGGSVTMKVRVAHEIMEIDIEDTGHGISAEELPRIFEKFFRSADQNVQEVTGTGLGLSLSREIVRLHGGDITVQSTLQQGSTFTVALPII